MSPRSGRPRNFSSRRFGSEVTVRWDVNPETVDGKLKARRVCRRQLAREVPSSLRALAAELAG